MALVIHSLSLVLTITALPRAHDPVPPLNARVLRFAQDQLGRKVGDGQCTSLAVEAYQHAGASLSRPFEPDGDFVWGEFVEKAPDVLPGDVLQFRDAVFKSRQRRTVRGRATIEIREHVFPHHTAIVEESRDGGRVLVILHQNTGPDDATDAERMIVQRETLRMSELKSGTIRAYHPVAD